jgi:protein-L-isoaspartate(D-aspartate) O-methyltransferase
MNSRYYETPSDDLPTFIKIIWWLWTSKKGINNGEPFLHAAWIASTNPRPGDKVCQIGAGSGFYTAILSVLASPGGSDEAFEIDAALSMQRD